MSFRSLPKYGRDAYHMGCELYRLRIIQAAYYTGCVLYGLHIILTACQAVLATDVDSCSSPLNADSGNNCATIYKLRS